MKTYRITIPIDTPEIQAENEEEAIESVIEAVTKYPLQYIDFASIEVREVTHEDIQPTSTGQGRRTI